MRWWLRERPSNRVKQIGLGVTACILLSLAFAWSGFFHQTIPRFSTSGGTALSGWSGWDRTDKLYVFGDSWSATLFDYKGRQPDSEHPLGNEPELARQNGPNWIHFIAEQYNTTRLKIYNFANGGAMVDDNVMKSIYQGFALSFRTQVHDIFRPHYASRNMQRDRYWDPVSTFFLICFGINELSISFREHHPLPIHDIISSYSAAVDELYFAGARNFLFLNIPPLNRAYALQKDTTPLALQIEDYNEELEIMRQKLIEKTPDANALMFDTHAFFEHIFNDPKSVQQTSGITRLQEKCAVYYMGVPLTKSGAVVMDHYSPKCGAPISEYFWMNELAPTFPVQNATAATVVEDCFGRGGPKRFCSS